MAPDSNSNVQNIESIEELTLFGLDKSPEGIASLTEGIESCVADLRAGTTRKTFNQLSALAEQLRELDLFEHSLCSLFNIDRRRIADRKGSLHTVMTDLRAKMLSLTAELRDDSLQPEFARLLEGLPPSLSRLNELIPVLKAHIEENYLCEERENV